MLKEKGLVVEVVYYDGKFETLVSSASKVEADPLPIAFSAPGQHNDSRMNMAPVMSAVHQEATVRCL